MASRAEVAKHLGVGGAKVSELVAKGIIPAPPGRGQFDIDGCRDAYISHLREIAAGRSAAGEGPDLVDERARLAKEQADKAAMENSARRGELLERSDVDAAVTAEFTRAKTRLLAIPSKAAPLIIQVDETAEAEVVLREAITEALQELSDPDELVAHIAAGGVDSGVDTAA